MKKESSASAHQSAKLRAEDKAEVQEHLRLKASVVYEIIRKEGVEELDRTLRSLWWSGFAAGLAISTSVYSEGFLHANLPATEWRPILENVGYCIGFLIVVLGRLQLFTENTITVVLPLLAETTRKMMLDVARLWGVVFAANMAGTFASTLISTYGGIIEPELLGAALEISRHFADRTPLEILQQGIPAGFLLAALVWVLPSSRGSEFWLILALTYMIALGDMAHVVAGSTEVFLLMLHGEITVVQAVGSFLLPAFVGNVIGGTGLFALIAYAQVRDEI